MAGVFPCSDLGTRRRCVTPGSVRRGYRELILRQRFDLCRGQIPESGPAGGTTERVVGEVGVASLITGPGLCINGSMAAINLTVRHGRSLDEARVQLEKTV